MDVDELEYLGLNVIAISTILLGIKKPVKRRYWERPHLGVKLRRVHGQQNLLKQMAISDADSFFSITRLRPESFWKLLSIVEPVITHVSPRPSIDAHTRLCVTLRYLVTGETRKSLSYTYRLGVSTTVMIIDETLSAIYNKLKPIYMPQPTTEMLLESANGFAKRWNFPNCSASVDGKHIRIKKPEKSGSLYFNYKGYHSVVMMATCDYKYRFLTVDVGCQGSNNDSVIFNDSEAGRRLMTNTFNMPGKKEIPFGPELPHFLLGDAIFGNRPYLITPYPGRTTGNLDYEKKIFNYRQSRARRVIENSFGIFVAEYRIFKTEIDAIPEIVDRIVLAAATLHNFRLTEQEYEQEPFDMTDYPDIPGRIEFSYLDSLEPPINDGMNMGGSAIRNQLAAYFVSDGSVYWQDQMIH